MTLNNTIHIKGEKIEIVESDHGIELKLTDAGREFMEAFADRKVKHFGVGNMFQPEGWPEEVIEFEIPYEFILAGLLEDTADIFELLNPRSDDYLRIGALTNSPIIARHVHRDDAGELDDVERVFWYPNYQVGCEIAELLRTGSVFFEAADN